MNNNTTPTAIPKKIWTAINNVVGQLGDDEFNGRSLDEDTNEDCDTVMEWLEANRPNSEDNPLSSWDRSRLESLVYYFVDCCHDGDSVCFETADNLYPELFPENNKEDDK